MSDKSKLFETTNGAIKIEPDGRVQYVSKDKKIRFSMEIDHMVDLLIEQVDKIFAEGDGIKYWDVEKELIKQTTAETSLICAKHYNGKIAFILIDKTLTDSEKIEKIRQDFKESKKELVECICKINGLVNSTTE